MTNNERKLKEIYWKVIKKLNDIDSSDGRVLDCGELGIMEVYLQNGCWLYKIYEEPEIIKIEDFLG